MGSISVERGAAGMEMSSKLFGSPLGLRLRKSESLLDLANAVFPTGADCRMNKTLDKMKASNFNPCMLSIGNWKRISKYDGDLVAKCYYAKQKLVWEVLENGLKSKIEILWKDILALNATYEENQPGSLMIWVGAHPLFFKEINPQPRKHTLWQASSDFTGGEATVCRQHFLQFPKGVLNKPCEQLLQCLKDQSSGVVYSRDCFNRCYVSSTQMQHCGVLDAASESLHFQSNTQGELCGAVKSEQQQLQAKFKQIAEHLLGPEDEEENVLLELPSISQCFSSYSIQ